MSSVEDRSAQETTGGRLNAPEWRVVLLLVAFAFLCHFNRLGMSVVGTERLIKGNIVSEPEMGAIYSSYLLIYTLAMIPGGWLIERFGPRAALGWMGFGSALLVILTGLPGWWAISAAGTWWALIAIRGGLGLVTAPMHPGAARTISFWIPVSGRGWGNGMVTGAAGLGAASTYYLFGFLMDELDWPGTFLVSGLLTAIVATVWLLTTADRRAEPVSASTGASLADAESAAAIAPTRNPETSRFHRLADVIPLLRDRSVQLVTISYVACGYLQYLFFYWIEHYFVEVVQLSTLQGRVCSTIATFAMAVGMIAGGFLSDRLQGVIGYRWGRASVAMTGMIGSALFALAAIHLHETRIVVACFVLAMGIQGMTEAPFWTTAVELGGRRGGLSAAILNTGGNIGGMLSPFTTPLIAKYLNFQAGIELACLFSLIGAILWCWIKPAEDRST
jgi:ACS family D-galactonate transporter-like MFS transporter